jgi:nucleotide-binding universal stress UspA family protein
MRARTRRRARSSRLGPPDLAPFAHLLVPIDLSEQNERQLRAARALVEWGHARVTLLHVIQQVRHLRAAELRPFYARLENASRRQLARAAKRFADAGAPVRTLVRVGDPPREIVRVAARRRGDLIVMGSHRPDPTGPGGGWARRATRSASSAPAPSSW